MFEHFHDQMKKMATEAYPKEGCALITRERGFYVVPNISTEPEKSFEIGKRVLTSAYKDGLLAVVHSHPDGPDCPSEADMTGQLSTGVPWVILSTDGTACTTPFAFGDGVPTPELVGRPFRHGVTDCYSIIRDYYKIHHKVTLKEFARDWEWWLPDKDEAGNIIQEPDDLYSKGFKKAGFKVITESEVQVGDVFLAQLRAKTPNHGGVYLGNGLILHHLTSFAPVDITRLSMREPLNRWQKFITHWLRYEDNKTVR